MHYLCMVMPMHCPYCQTPLAETVKECPSCQLSLASANALLGPIPRFAKGLNDTVKVLDKSGTKKIQQSLAEITRRFPQVDMHVVTGHFDQQYPVSTHMFWLLNHGGFAPSELKGAKNRTILLALDPKHGRIGLIVGYGLEPFLPRKALDHVLEKAQPSLDAADYTKAILVVIDALDQLMSGVCEGLEETLGITIHSEDTQQTY